MALHCLNCGTLQPDHAKICDSADEGREYQVAKLLMRGQE